VGIGAPKNLDERHSVRRLAGQYPDKSFSCCAHLAVTLHGCFTDAAETGIE